MSRLQPSTFYRFRLFAVNEHGKSGYSDVISLSTSGNPPTQPQAPILQNATSSTLRLSWSRRATNEEFSLQMNDRDSGHGYLAMYTGRDTVYECTGLRRASMFFFRLRADNEGGHSPWSDEISFHTLPERPGRPGKPQIKGKIHSNYFKTKWDPPTDSGGVDVSLYHLEISSGAGFERIYTGAETEAVCDRLNPGTTYQVRVNCEGDGGVSVYSELGTMTTEATVPSSPSPPFCSNHPGPYAAVLRWDKPDYNGGAPVLEYELELDDVMSKTKKIVYKGKELYCVVKDLLPGELYTVQLRALNRIGAGSWSESFSFNAGAAPPSVPTNLDVTPRTPTHLTIGWHEPNANGASITEYRLESSTQSPEINSPTETTTSTTTATSTFNIVYQGLQSTAEIRNLQPFTTYYFRVCAFNVSGQSPFSTVLTVKTTAAPPNIPIIDSYKVTSTDLILLWKATESNGSPIQYYNIDLGDRVYRTETSETEYSIKGLTPETNYKVKIQAVNEIGCGGYSSSLKLTTLPLPPRPPKLECMGSGHNFLKLKWGDKKNIDFTRYYLEMYNSRSKEFTNVYSGTSYTYKINKLQEQTTYTFRICAETDNAGFGDFSDEFLFSTCPAQPNSIKAPRIVQDGGATVGVTTSTATTSTSSSGSSCSSGSSDGGGGANGGNSDYDEDHVVSVNSNNSFTIEWQTSKNGFTDSIEYILQCAKTKDLKFREVSDKKFFLLV